MCICMCICICICICICTCKCICICICICISALFMNPGKITCMKRFSHLSKTAVALQVGTRPLQTEIAESHVRHTLIPFLKGTRAYTRTPFQMAHSPPSNKQLHGELPTHSHAAFRGSREVLWPEEDVTARGCPFQCRPAIAMKMKHAAAGHCLRVYARWTNRTLSRPPRRGRKAVGQPDTPPPRVVATTAGREAAEPKLVVHPFVAAEAALVAGAAGRVGQGPCAAVECAPSSSSFVAWHQ